jgi:hypothetical protein
MNTLSNAGRSTLGVARRKNHPAIVTFLQSRGAVDDGMDDDDDDDDDDEEEED